MRKTLRRAHAGFYARCAVLCRLGLNAEPHFIVGREPKEPCWDSNRPTKMVCMNSHVLGIGIEALEMQYNVHRYHLTPNRRHRDQDAR